MPNPLESILTEEMKREIKMYRYLCPSSDQLNFGVCWAMVISRLLSAIYSRQLDAESPVELSPQHMVDCFFPIVNRNLDKEGIGPLGDYPLSTLFALTLVKYIGGVCLESEYEYQEVRGLCRQNIKGVRVFPSEEITRFEDDEDEAIRETLDQGIPIAANITGFQSFHDYENGIYEPLSGEKAEGRHSVLIVGYGQDGDSPYYWIQNSWGEHWGIRGFGKVKKSLLFHFVTVMEVMARTKTD